MVIANPPNVKTINVSTNNPCDNIAFSPTPSAGDGSITLTDGTIPAGTSSNPGECDVYVDVTASVAANYTNTIPAGALHTTTNVTNGFPASANVLVYPVGGPGGQTNLGVTGSKSFNPNVIPEGGNSDWTIKI